MDRQPTFADRAARMFTNYSHPIPSRDEGQHEQYDLDQFQNYIPSDGYSHEMPPLKPIRPLILTRPTQNDLDNSTTASRPQRNTPFKTFVLPLLILSVPMALLSATLLGLVFGYRVESDSDIFDGNNNNPQLYHPSYILVNYSATRLVFAASFLSTVAPLLASTIMSLWGLVVAATLKVASEGGNFQNLPTPYQLSILIGLCLSSMEQLRTYVGYLFSRKRRTALPPILQRAAAIYIITILLAGFVFVTDTVLHYTTSTIEFDRTGASSNVTQQYGRGMSQMCLSLNRVADNFGFPCSMNLGGKFADLTRQDKRNELSRLTFNISSVSEIRMTDAPGLNPGSMALLVPRSTSIPDGLDFNTSTVGVATQCKFVPASSCLMKSSGYKNTFTQFNCSDNFYGVLGESPNINAINGVKAVDPDIPPLGFKPSSNIQWSFFNDPGLQNIYNPGGYNATTNQPGGNPLPDSALINPFYMGIAMRLATSSVTTGSPMVNESAIFNSGVGYFDFVLQCSVSSYDVNYTWYKSQIQDVSYVPSNNGSVLYIYQGAQQYFTISGGGADLQQYLQEAAIAGNTTKSFLDSWANLYSTKVMAQIGPYLTPRTNFQEQARDHILVAQVYKASLGALVGCSLIYTVMGVILVLYSYKATAVAVQVIADQLSLAGLTNVAFGEKKSGSPGSSDSVVPSEDYFQKADQRETRRVRISGTEFRVWV